MFDDSSEYNSILCYGGAIKRKQCLLIIAIVIIKLFWGEQMFDIYWRQCMRFFFFFLICSPRIEHK